MCITKFFLPVLCWFPLILSDLGDIMLCQESHILLVANSTSGTTVTYINSRTTETVVVNLEDRYLPSPQICGENYDGCNAATSVNQDITVLVFPLGDGVGLVSYIGDSNNSLMLHQSHILTNNLQNFEDCVFTYFVRYQGRFIGYCVDFSTSRTLYALSISVNYQSLNLSTIRRDRNDFITQNTYNLGLSSTYTNFILIPNAPPRCFSNNSPHVLFLVNNRLVDHVYEDAMYDTYGSIHTSESNVCTRIQHIGEDCKLAAYCGGEVVIFGGFESLSVSFRIATGDSEGHVFVCSSNRYVRLGNESLTLHDATTQMQLGSVPFPYSFETIQQGSCHTFGTNVYFFVVLGDGRSVKIDFTHAKVAQLGTSKSADTAVLRVGGPFAAVSNGSHTLIHNWTLSCSEDPLVLQSSLTFVTVYSSSSVGQCRCEANPTLPTTELTSMSSMTTSPITTQSSAQGLSGGVITAIVLSVLAIIVSVPSLILTIILLVIICTHIIIPNRRK